MSFDRLSSRGRSFTLAGVLLFLSALAGGASPAQAFEWDVFTKLTPDMKTCLAEDIGESDLDDVISLNGRKPRGRPFRQKVAKAYNKCLRRVSANDGNIGGPKCTALPPPYRGPLFDAMTQADHRDIRDVVGLLKSSSVSRVALFARSIRHLGENESDVLSLKRDNPDFLVLGVPKYFKFGGEISRDYIDAAIAGIRENNYAFIGEILFTHGDKDHGETTSEGERYIDPNNQGMTTFIQRLAGLGRPVPFMAHWEVYAWDRDWPQFSRLYKAHPAQPFIMPHMGFGSVQQVGTILSEHANVYVTTSKKETDKGGYSDASKAAQLGDGFMDNCGALKPKWAQLLTRHKDRILFATDAHKSHRWERYPKLINAARKWLGQLPDDVTQAIAHGNAERLYGVR